MADKMSCAILSGGKFTKKDAGKLKKLNGIVICADSGYDNALKFGITPDIVIGDFDSVKGEINCSEVLKFPPEKDDTDTMLAAKVAIERGFESITLFGFFGERLDHFIANLSVMYYLRKKISEVFAIYKDSIITAAHNETVIIKKTKNNILSLIPFDGKAVVSITGVKYPLDRHTLICDSVLGISNEITENIAKISILDGFVFIIFSKEQ